MCRGISSARMQGTPLRVCDRISPEVEKCLINNLKIEFYFTCLFFKKVSTCKGLGKKKRKRSHWSFTAGEAVSQGTSATFLAQNHSSPDAQSLSLYYCSQHWNYQSRDPLLLSAKGGHLTQARPLRLLLPWGPQSEKCVLRKEVAGAILS